MVNGLSIGASVIRASLSLVSFAPIAPRTDITSGIRFGQLFATGNDTSLDNHRYVRAKYPAHETLVFLSQVDQASPTVHPAGCDQGRIELYLMEHK